MMLATPNVDLASLYLFVEVVELGSISRAAAASGVTQPSASARIRDFESRLGLRLLERSSTGARPTDAGRLVARWANDVVTAVAQLEAGAEALERTANDTLHIAASFTIAEFLLPSWLATLRSREPSVRAALQVKNSTDVEDLVDRGNVHLGFVEGPLVTRPLDSRVVARDELVIVAPSNHHWYQRACPLSAEDLVREPLVLREPGSGTREALTSALRVVGLGEPRIAMEAGSTISVLHAVIDGAGPTVISRLAVESDIAAGLLTKVRVIGLDLTRELRAVWREDRALSGPASMLLTMAAQAGSCRDA